MGGTKLTTDSSTGILAVFPEDMSSVLRTHCMQLINNYDSRSRGPNAFSWPSRYPILTHTYTPI